MTRDRTTFKPPWNRYAPAENQKIPDKWTGENGNLKLLKRASGFDILSTGEVIPKTDIADTAERKIERYKAMMYKASKPAKADDYIKFRKQVNNMKNRLQYNEKVKQCLAGLIDGIYPFRHSMTDANTSIALVVTNKAFQRRHGLEDGYALLTLKHNAGKHQSRIITGVKGHASREEAIEAFDEIYDKVDLPVKDAYFDEAGLVISGNRYKNTLNGYENSFPKSSMTDGEKRHYAMLDLAIERYIERGQKADIVNAARYAATRNRIATGAKVKMGNDRDIAAHLLKRGIKPAPETREAHCEVKYEIPNSLSKDESKVLEGLVEDAVKQTAKNEVATFIQSRMQWLNSTKPKK